MTPPFKADPQRVRGLLLGAAVGDALGWPQEDRNNIVGGARARDVEPQARFRAWRRNAGTQFARYEDPVGAGEYSDDTQLMLAVARACLHGDGWLRWLTEVELPTWPLYQRGGGRAVLSASRAWADGHLPWIVSKSKDQQRVAAYFNAGANGVAMRIAPHAVVTADTEDAGQLLERIVTDGLTTHGHPRALVGACVHALAVRHALVREGTLGYGDLIRAVLDDYRWRDDDLIGRVATSEWINGFRQSSGEDPAVAWKITADEMTDLLRMAEDALRSGAMANDEQVLERMGCFDKTRNGAGTISAAATLYLAARSAARPLGGLLRSAYLKRADTDTLASMTASLLGAVQGWEWLGGLATAVQDHDYLSETAYRLARRPDDSADVGATVTERRSIATALDQVRAAIGDREASFVPLPDGRPVEVLERLVLPTKSNAVVERVVGRAIDGQQLVFDKVSRGRPTQDVRDAPEENPTAVPPQEDVKRDTIPERSAAASTARIMTVRLKVRDLERASNFYADMIGIDCEQQSDKTVLVGSLMVLQRARPEEATGFTHRFMVTIAVKNLNDVTRRLNEAGYPYERVGAPERKQLWLRDLDGHAVHVSELAADWPS